MPEDVLDNNHEPKMREIDDYRRPMPPKKRITLIVIFGIIIPILIVYTLLRSYLAS